MMFAFRGSFLLFVFYLCSFVLLMRILAIFPPVQYQPLRRMYRGGESDEGRATTVSVTADGHVQVVISAETVPSGADVVDLLGSIARNRKPPAIFVIIPESVAHRFLPQMIKMEFSFHRFDDTVRSFVYYRWNDEGPDQILPASNSSDCVTMMVLSPDEMNIFMVKEANTWMFPVHTVAKGKGIVSDVGEALKNRAGIFFDSSVGVSYVGGWIREKGRHSNIHERMDVYAVRASFEKSSITDRENRWIPIAELRQAYRKNLSIAERETSQVAPMSRPILHEGEDFNKYHLTWLDKFADRGGLNVSMEPGSNGVFLIGHV